MRGPWIVNVRSRRGVAVGQHRHRDHQCPSGRAVGLEPADAPAQPLDRASRLIARGSAIIAASSATSPAVKSVAALDPTGNLDAVGRVSGLHPIDHGTCPGDRSSGARPPLCAHAVRQPRRWMLRRDPTLTDVARLSSPEHPCPLMLKHRQVRRTRLQKFEEWDKLKL